MTGSSSLAIGAPSTVKLSCSCTSSTRARGLITPPQESLVCENVGEREELRDTSFT